MTHMRINNHIMETQADNTLRRPIYLPTHATTTTVSSFQSAGIPDNQLLEF